MESVRDYFFDRGAARALGIFTREDALEDGYSISGINRRLQSGEWQRIHNGVYRIATPSDDREHWLSLLHANLLYGGSGSVVSHLAAAALHRFDAVRGYPIDLIVPLDSQYRTKPARRSALKENEVAVVEGLPTTTPLRTVMDLAGCVSRLQLEHAIESVLRGEDRRRPDQWKQHELRALWAYVDEWHGRRGVQRVRRALMARGDRRPTGSPAETVLLHACPNLRTQPTVGFAAPVGARTFFPDTAVDRCALLVDVDGAIGHASEEQRTRDLERQNVLSKVFPMLRFPASRVFADPGACAREIVTYARSLPTRADQWSVGEYCVTRTADGFRVDAR